MTLTQMTYFEAVCQYKNVTKAAEALFVSRSAVSRAMKELETEWNVVLFKRSRTGVELTEDGDQIRKMFGEFNKAYVTLRKYMSETKRGTKPTTLHIGITPTTGSKFFPDFFTSFLNENPEISLEISEHQPLDCYSLLTEGTCDFFITPHIPADVVEAENLSSKTIYKAELVVAVSDKSQYADKNFFTQDELSKLKFATLMVPLPDDVFNNPFEEVCPSFCHDRNIVLRTSQHKLLHRAVACGICAAILPKDLMEDWDGVKCISFEPRNYTDVSLVWNKDYYFSDVFNAFMKFLQKYQWPE